MLPIEECSETIFYSVLHDCDKYHRRESIRYVRYNDQTAQYFRQNGDYKIEENVFIVTASTQGYYFQQFKNYLDSANAGVFLQTNFKPSCINMVFLHKNKEGKLVFIFIKSMYYKVSKVR